MAPISLLDHQIAVQSNTNFMDYKRERERERERT
uniref:Uncharacterized protein n=1 Tax=Phlebotomus papatasi TaxID=29031 RepID=A0A1B0GM88_PHLPP